MYIRFYNNRIYSGGDNMEYTYQMINEHGSYIRDAFKSPVLFKENQRINYEGAGAFIISNIQYNIKQGKQDTIFLIVRGL